MYISAVWFIEFRISMSKAGTSPHHSLEAYINFPIMIERYILDCSGVEGELNDFSNKRFITCKNGNPWYQFCHETLPRRLFFLEDTFDRFSTKWQIWILLWGQWPLVTKKHKKFQKALISAYCLQLQLSSPSEYFNGVTSKNILQKTAALSQNLIYIIWRWLSSECYINAAALYVLSVVIIIDPL